MTEAFATQRIALANAAAGMTLAEDVLDERRNVILPQGVALNETSIASLQRRQIAEIAIVASAAASVAAARVDAEAVTQKINTLFRKCADDAANQRLKKAMIAYRTGGI